MTPSKTEPKTSRLISAEELAEHLAVSTWTVRRLANAGELPFVRVGRMMRFDVGLVQQALTGNPKSAQPTSA